MRQRKKLVSQVDREYINSMKYEYRSSMESVDLSERLIDGSENEIYKQA